MAGNLYSFQQCMIAYIPNGYRLNNTFTDTFTIQSYYSSRFAMHLYIINVKRLLNTGYMYMDILHGITLHTADDQLTGVAEYLSITSTKKMVIELYYPNNVSEPIHMCMGSDPLFG